MLDWLTDWPRALALMFLTGMVVFLSEGAGCGSALREMVFLDASMLLWIGSSARTLRLLLEWLDCEFSFLFDFELVLTRHCLIEYPS
jgi:hypothetical protein